MCGIASVYREVKPFCNDQSYLFLSNYDFIVKAAAISSGLLQAIFLGSIGAFNYFWALSRPSLCFFIGYVLIL